LQKAIHWAISGDCFAVSHYEEQGNTTVYKIDYSDVAAKPEVAFKLVKRLVGERGFEPPTPWSRTRFQSLVKFGEMRRFQVIAVALVAASLLISIETW
jgi:hypothetical protein